MEPVHNTVLFMSAHMFIILGLIDSQIRQSIS